MKMNKFDNIPSDLLKEMWHTMLRIRIFEERVAELLENRDIKCPTHLYIGQEAIATGVCAALRRDDYIFGTHRSHGHYLAKGGDMKLMMAELFGKKTGCSGGRGGSMHLLASEVGILGTVPMVAATIPISVGAALGSVMKNNDRVSVSFFGDGATEEGSFHESLNFASLKNLPVIFVCENNFFSSHLVLSERQPADNIYQAAEIHNMPGIRVDGNNVTEVLLASREAVKRARDGVGPTLMECRTYRWRGHVGPGWDLDAGIRSEAELEAWMKMCPIGTLEAQMLQSGILSDDELGHTRSQVVREVALAESFAKDAPYPDVMELNDHVFVS
jgi:TPP-dependent pyruvate/acetoin dehydrogenase alpha subunit